MDRAEALAVLHEISEVCKESVQLSSVSLDYLLISSSSKDYAIKIKCALDPASKQCISPVLKKHKLSLNESEGLVVIRSAIL